MLKPYLAGLLFGDGTSHIRACSVWIDQVERNEPIILRAKEELEKIAKKVHYYRHTKNKIRAMIYSKKIYYEFLALRKDPVGFFNSLKENEKKKFIAGFFDAEGTVTDRLVLYNNHLKLLKAIKSFFTKEKIISYIYKFGKVYGVQIYQIESVKKFTKIIPSVKLSKHLFSSQVRNVAFRKSVKIRT